MTGLPGHIVPSAHGESTVSDHCTLSVMPISLRHISAFYTYKYLTLYTCSCVSFNLITTLRLPIAVRKENQTHILTNFEKHPTPFTMGPSQKHYNKTTSGSSSKDHTRRFLDEVDAKVTSSTLRSTSSETQTLPDLIIRLLDFLQAKASDGIDETESGRPGLNRDIRTVMEQVKAHPRFKDLKIDDYHGTAPEFEKVWMMLEKHAQGWKDDGSRQTRLQEGIELHKVFSWIQNAELDGKYCVEASEL